MSSATRNLAATEAPGRVLLRIIGVLLGIVVLFMVLTAPVERLLGAGQWALPAAMHGLMAFLLIVIAAVSLYLAERLYHDRVERIADLQINAVVAATLAFLTIVFGNWFYIGYRAGGGVREWLLANAPEVHRVFFEFKEFVALFTLPIAVAAAYILWRYGAQVRETRAMRFVLATLFVLLFVATLAAFGLGAAVTKLKAV